MKNKVVVIWGTHPVRSGLIEQYRQAGTKVLVFDSLVIDCCLEPLPDEMVILTDVTGDGFKQDQLSLRFLRDLADQVGAREDRLLVHLLVREAITLRMCREMDFPSQVNAAFEVYPFTMEESWAETVLVRLPGINANLYPALDREPIGEESGQFVHLVISGSDSYAQSMAQIAAQVSHFPNYVGKGNPPLRTRITFIQQGIEPFRDQFVAQYQTLFNHSYYRTIWPARKVSQFHHPQYEGVREDFVDVEWEFVDAPLSHPVVVDKLTAWSSDANRQLTIVLSDASDSINVKNALSLPSKVFDRHIPVLVRLHANILPDTARQDPRFSNLLSFGMDYSGYNVHLPVVRMSRLLHYIYTFCSISGSIPTVLPPEDVKTEWRKAVSLKHRLSNAYCVMTMATKMHSIGHDKSDPVTFYALTEDEVATLTRAEHNRWCVEKLLSGFRPCTEKERAAVEADISRKKELKETSRAHYDLCAFDELRSDENGLDVRVYDRTIIAAIPLLVLTYLKEERP